MIGVYLSGTGNTKHCIEKMLSLWEETASAVSIEDERAVRMITESQVIVLAYPIQFSNMPFMVREFIESNYHIWRGKDVFCLTTMGLFSGDGTGCSARLLEKYGANVIGGLQIVMPDSICDSKLLKKPLEKNREIVDLAEKKIAHAVSKIKAGDYPTEGLGILAHMIGLFGQRLWFYNKTRGYSDKLKINESCTGCGSCARVCPMKNITMQTGKPVTKQRCTMCYRCISLCPQKAITLLGKETREQWRLERDI